MDLSPEILKAVRAMGFDEPSTVQKLTIPLMMNGAEGKFVAQVIKLSMPMSIPMILSGFSGITGFFLSVSNVRQTVKPPYSGTTSALMNFPE